MEISGRLTANATVRTINENKSVVNFSVAEDQSYYQNNQRVERTTFYEVGYWGSVKVADYLLKGTVVKLAGRVEANAYIDKNGEVKGTLRFTPELRGIKILAKAKGTPQAGTVQNQTPPVDTKPSKTQGKQGKTNEAGEEDDLPF